VELVGLRKIPVILNQDEAGKIDSRLEAVSDCTLIFIMQIGASAAARVTRRKIMPVKVAMGSPIDEQVKRLVATVRLRRFNPDPSSITRPGNATISLAMGSILHLSFLLGTQYLS